MANVDIKKAFEFTGEMKHKRNGNNRTFLGVERRVWNIAMSRVIEAYTALRLRTTVWLHLLSTCGIFAHFTLMTTLLPHPMGFFFFGISYNRGLSSLGLFHSRVNFEKIMV